MGLTSCACSRSGSACYSASHLWNPSDSGALFDTRILQSSILLPCYT